MIRAVNRPRAMPKSGPKESLNETATAILQNPFQDAV